MEHGSFVRALAVDFNLQIEGNWVTNSFKKMTQFAYEFTFYRQSNGTVQAVGIAWYLDFESLVILNVMNIFEFNNLI